MGANDLPLDNLDLTVSRWGNSLAVRLPAKLARELHVDEGSHLSAAVVAPGCLTLQSAEAVRDVPSREAVIAELQDLHSRLPLGRSVVRFMRDQGY